MFAAFVKEIKMKNCDICNRCTSNIGISGKFFNENWSKGFVFCPRDKYKDDLYSLTGLIIQNTKDDPDKDCKYYMEQIVSNETD